MKLVCGRSAAVFCLWVARLKLRDGCPKSLGYGRLYSPTLRSASGALGFIPDLSQVAGGLSFMMFGRGTEIEFKVDRMRGLGGKVVLLKS